MFDIRKNFKFLLWLFSNRRLLRQKLIEFSMVKAAQFIGRERSPLGDEVINNAVKRVSIMLFENDYQNDDLNWEYELKDLSVGYVSKFCFKNNLRCN